MLFCCLVLSAELSQDLSWPCQTASSLYELLLVLIVLSIINKTYYSIIHMYSNNTELTVYWGVCILYFWHLWYKIGQYIFFHPVSDVIQLDFTCKWWVITPGLMLEGDVSDVIALEQPTSLFSLGKRQECMILITARSIAHNVRLTLLSWQNMVLHWLGSKITINAF